MEAIILAIAKAISVASTVEKTVEDAVPFAEAIYNNLFKGQTATQEQLDALEAAVDQLHSDFQKPMSPGIAS